MQNWKQKLAWLSGGMTLAFFVPVIWIVTAFGEPIGHAMVFLEIWTFGFPEWMMILVLTSIFMPIVRSLDLYFNLFGFNDKCDAHENSE
jgi:hypothetical protein